MSCRRGMIVRVSGRWFMWALATVLLAAAAVAQPASPSAPPAASAAPAAVAPVVVEGVGITVTDLDQAVAFYTGVLGFRASDPVELSSAAFEHLTGVFGSRARRATLQLGEEQIVLTQYLAPEGRPFPADSHSNDRWFQHIAIVVSDIDRAYAHLRSHKVRHASSGPQTLPQSLPNAAGISAFYFKDPDGHVLEVIHFPQGKGDPRWQKPTSELFLGIDHTAIVVADTDASVAFYQRVLGLHVAGGSENFGTEQEHLNNVFGARLRITALKGAAGPGVELLEYLAPTGGRPMPADSKLNDLWGWQTLVRASDISAVDRAARAARAKLISPGIVDPQAARAGEAGLSLRDPDGHALVVAPDSNR